MEIVNKFQQKRFLCLNEEQRKQVEFQLGEHQHNTYEIKIVIDDDLTLNSFNVCANVMRPEVMSSKILAKYLWENKRTLYKKTVVDMGCGSGIQGIVAGLAGAKEIILSDFTDTTILNATHNVIKYGLQNKVEVVKGDLFEKIHKQVDIVIFNHPFFPDHPLDEIEVSFSMLDSGELIQRFFKQAKKIVGELIIMPYYSLAGEINSPAIQCEKFGYIISKETQVEIKDGLQRGIIPIYEIIPSNKISH